MKGSDPKQVDWLILKVPTGVWELRVIEVVPDIQNDYVTQHRLVASCDSFESAEAAKWLLSGKAQKMRKFSDALDNLTPEQRYLMSKGLTDHIRDGRARSS